MLRKQPISENDLLLGLRERIRGLFPPPDEGWDVRVEFSSDIGADGTLLIKIPKDRWVTVPIDVRWDLQPRMVAELARRARTRAPGPSMVMAPYLSPETQARLADVGFNYADLTGNLRIVLDEPPILLRSTGAVKDPNPPQRALQSLKGPGAGAVVRALCDFKPPYLISELASRAKLPVATVFRVVELLDRDGLVDRDETGRIVGSDWLGMLQRWARDYQVLRNLDYRTYLEPRGLPALVDKLKKVEAPYSVTGSLAAARYAAVAAPALAMIYADDVSDLAAQLSLKPVARGMNVILIQSRSKAPFERTRIVEGVAYANPSQVAVDLLGGPGRSPQEGEALLTWMRDHESAWRD